jgi:hypothetical protein
MLHHDRTPYRWQDHMVTPRRATLNLIATALIVALVGTAGLFGGRSPDTPTHVAIATERPPSLAQLVKRSLHSLPAVLRRC